VVRQWIVHWAATALKLRAMKDAGLMGYMDNAAMPMMLRQAGLLSGRLYDEERIKALAGLLSGR